MTNETLQIYPDTDYPGNSWKITLPNGDFLFFDTKEKAKQFVELYNQSPKRKP